MGSGGDKERERKTFGRPACGACTLLHIPFLFCNFAGLCNDALVSFFHGIGASSFSYLDGQANG
jgi:hypothetical protein